MMSVPMIPYPNMRAPAHFSQKERLTIELQSASPKCTRALERILFSSAQGRSSRFISDAFGADGSSAKTFRHCFRDRANHSLIFHCVPL